MRYGNPPKSLGIVRADCGEMMHYQSLPIKFIGTDFRMPRNLEWVAPVLELVQACDDDYVYLTAWRKFITRGVSGSRPGWHSDGFLTEDINYIWSDCLPTEFVVQEFCASGGCNDSMTEFAEQAQGGNIIRYDDETLLRLDSSVVHRPAENNLIDRLRTFLKVTVSKDKHNLEGNSHNYDFDYEWDMAPRHKDRNHQSIEMINNGVM